MPSQENYAIRPLNTGDVEQYNALLRYAFQITEQELSECGWQDDEIKQSKFPVLERADVLGCFDGETLCIADRGLSAEDERLRRGVSRRLCYQRVHLSGILRPRHHEATDASEPRAYASARSQPLALLFPYSIPLYRKMGLGDHLQQDFLYR